MNTVWQLLKDLHDASMSGDVVTVSGVDVAVYRDPFRPAVMFKVVVGPCIYTTPGLVDPTATAGEIARMARLAVKNARLLNQPPNDATLEELKAYARDLNEELISSLAYIQPFFTLSD